MRYLIAGLIGLLALSSLAYAIVGMGSMSSSRTYLTWESLEPDNWASTWLIKRHIDPDATVEVRPTGDSLSGGIAFGVPQAQYRRTADHSTFQSLLELLDDSDPVLQRMGELVATIEATAWYSGDDPWVDKVERNFRRLQDHYGRAYVPIGCYGQFFDALYQALEDDMNLDSLDGALAQAGRQQDCASAQSLAERVGNRRVAELSIDQLLGEIASGQDVVFVDTREPAEYEKSHIPGAINIPMRDLNADIYDRLQQADRVVSYCVKDFRGYEVARLMLENGVNQSAVMKPHGLSGWQATGLPLTEDGVPEQLASQQLLQCARDRSSCELN